MLRNILSLLICAMLLPACSREQPDYSLDHFSFANSKQFITRHLALDLDVDFEAEQLRGTATLHMERFLRGVGRLYLIEPVYRALAENGSDRDLAGSIFGDARDSYHPLTVAAIERTLAPE